MGDSNHVVWGNIESVGKADSSSSSLQHPHDARIVPCSGSSETQDSTELTTPAAAPEASPDDARAREERNRDQHAELLALHEQGTCKVCVFFSTPLGCNRGAACTFCHQRHSRKDKSRPCKSKRERQKRIIDRVQGIGEPALNEDSRARSTRVVHL